MPKVVTSQGLNEFVSSGKPTEEMKTPPKIKAVANGAAPPLEVKEDKPAADLKDPHPKAEEERAPPEDLEEARVKADWSKDVLDEITRKNATINRKHREMKEAQAALTDAEEFARTQWNEKRIAAERAAQLEKELAELKEKGAPPPQAKAEKGKPDPQKFYDDKGQFKAFEYAEELAAYSATKAVEDDRKAQAKVAQERALAVAEEKARARVTEAQKKYPDYESVLAASTAKTHKEVLGYLSDSPFIGDVSYYMAKNPAFVERINAMHPYQAIAEIGKLELTFVKPDPAKAEDEPAPAKVTPGAPPPIKPLAASSSVNINTDPAKMSYKELRAYERARMGRRS